MEPEIIPAILVKSREELLRRISIVKDHVNIIHIDIMDNEFVPNKTIGLESLHDLPEASYGFHWMVRNPEKWIEATPGPHLHLVHVETVASFESVKSAVKKAGGRLGFALNPDTPLESVLSHMDGIEEILLMTVHPGFSGQKYIQGVESKIRRLRKLYPGLNIGADGGINKETIGRAYSAGANYLAAASAIFANPDIGKAVKELKECARSGCPE
jgi:ribulose-phosphate 3-epimerase